LKELREILYTTIKNFQFLNKYAREKSIPNFLTYKPLMKGTKITGPNPEILHNKISNSTIKNFYKKISQINSHSLANSEKRSVGK